MDEVTMRAWLGEVRNELDQLEKHRDVLLRMIQAAEDWLTINATAGRQLPFEAPRPRVAQPTVSAYRDPRMRINRVALAKVVHDAAGATIHANEVAQRAKDAGYWSTAKNLPGTVDSILKQAVEQGEPIERLGDRLYRSTKFIIRNGHSQVNVVTPPVKRTKPKGAMSFRSAITQVLTAAEGASLHTDEIWRRVQPMGVVTSAADPPRMIDLTLRSITGAEKVGPRTWRIAPRTPSQSPTAQSFALVGDN